MKKTSPKVQRLRLKGWVRVDGKGRILTAERRQPARQSDFGKGGYGIPSHPMRGFYDL